MQDSHPYFTTIGIQFFATQFGPDWKQAMRDMGIRSQAQLDRVDVDALWTGGIFFYNE